MENSWLLVFPAPLLRLVCWIFLCPDFCKMVLESAWRFGRIWSLETTLCWDMEGKRQRHCLNLLDSPDEAGAKPLSVEDALMLKPPRRPAPSTIRPLLGSFVRMLVLPSLFHFKQEGLGSKCSLDIDNIAETLDKSSLCNMIWHPFWFFFALCLSFYRWLSQWTKTPPAMQPCSHAA